MKRNKMNKPVALMAALALGVLASSFGPASPASAFVGDPVKVKLGQTLKLDRDPIEGNSTTYQANYRANDVTVKPADCAGEPVGCEVVPIELDIPQEDPDEIETQGYILTVIVDWDPGQRVNNVFQVGTVYENHLESALYQDPLAVDSAGNATYTARSNTTQPASLVSVSPTSKKFQLVVANFNGINRGYKLEVSLSSAALLKFNPDEFSPGNDNDFTPPPTFTPPDSTPQQNGFGGASGSGFLPPPGPGTAPTAPAAMAGFDVPNIPGGKADPMLVAIGDVDVRSGLGLRAVKVESTIANMGTDRSGGMSVALGLLGLPLAIALVMGFLLFRKRSSGRTPTPAAA